MTVTAAIAVVLQTILLVRAGAAAPVTALNPIAAEISSATSSPSADSAPASAGAPLGETTLGHRPELAHDIPDVSSVGRLFDSREFELSLSDEADKMHRDPASCFSPEVHPRPRGEGAEGCRVIEPTGGRWEFSELLFFALCGWGLVVVAVAGLHRLYGNWRVWRWLRRMRSLGLVPRTANLRRLSERGERRSSSRAKPRRRHYAG